MLMKQRVWGFCSGFSQPVVYQFAGQAQLLGYLRQIVAAEEVTGRKLLVLKLDFPAFVFGGETNHHPAWVGPWLATEVLQVLDADTGFFHHFAVHAFLECLSGFQESGYQSVVGSSEILGAK